jgi:hypothetical protein
VKMQHPLSGPLALKVLDAEAEEGLQLKSVELTRSVASQWAKHRFDKPLRVALHRGRFFHAYLVGAVEGLLGVADPAIRVIDEKWLSTRDALSLNQMSSQTHQAAILRRRWKQAQALVQAMRNQQLDPPTLRELLMGPMGQLDGDLVAAVAQRLRVTRAGPNAWRLFFEAGAYR